MKTITRYKVSISKQNSTKWETQWFKTETEAKAFEAFILSDNPNHKVVLKAWEFDEPETLETTKTIAMPGHLEPKKKIMFEILKNSIGSFIVVVQGTQTLSEDTYASEEDAMVAIENYMKTPFNYCGMPSNA